jgi:uncharacterized membrane protein YeaQ/YmgE (transglycosylase-associated protein family)
MGHDYARNVGARFNMNLMWYACVGVIAALIARKVRRHAPWTLLLIATGVAGAMAGGALGETLGRLVSLAQEGAFTSSLAGSVLALVVLCRVWPR